jgi:hypothetical protein
MTEMNAGIDQRFDRFSLRLWHQLTPKHRLPVGMSRQPVPRLRWPRHPITALGLVLKKKF